MRFVLLFDRCKVKCVDGCQTVTMVELIEILNDGFVAALTKFLSTFLQCKFVRLQI